MEKREESKLYSTERESGTINMALKAVRSGPFLVKMNKSKGSVNLRERYQIQDKTLRLNLTPVKRPVPSPTSWMVTKGAVGVS